MTGLLQVKAQTEVFRFGWRGLDLLVVQRLKPVLLLEVEPTFGRRYCSGKGRLQRKSCGVLFDKKVSALPKVFKHKIPPCIILNPKNLLPAIGAQNFKVETSLGGRISQSEMAPKSRFRDVNNVFNLSAPANTVKHVMYV